MSVKIAVCQVPDTRMDIEASLQWVEKFTQDAVAENVSIHETG